VVDPVTFAVVESRLSGIVQEMQDSIFRTGYSTIVRESQDASCMILDAGGNVVGEHAILPLHVASLPEVVRAIERSFGADVHPGDAFITNHPYEAGLPHSMDMAVVTPFFSDGRLVAFCGNIAHKSDLGGVVPGTAYGSARELFQEGIQYPPVRYIARGERVRDVEAIVRANSRTPDVVLGDIRGQLGCARLGERRLTEMIARYGLETVLEVFSRMQDVTERRIRTELAAWPDGAFEAESFVDNDGITLDRPVRYHVRVEKRGDRISFDFTRSDDQAQGPVNIRPPMARGCCYYALIAMIDPRLHNDAGVARVVETTFRAGSVLDPSFPAPCNSYMASTIAVCEAALKALSGFVPGRRMAGNAGAGAQSITGQHPDGRPFVQYEFVGSAYGGHAGGDGLSGTAVLISNVRAASIEALENEFPTRIARWELVRDSGGPGEFRGGLGPRRVWEILTDDAQLTVRGGKHVCPADGRDGGRPGGLGSCTVNPGTPRGRSLPSYFSGVLLRYGDVVAYEKAGGGGLGDPARRAFEKIVDDTIDGYVSRESAITDYGVDARRLDAAIALWAAPEHPVLRRTADIVP
jgi:N-methylhydantoinase B